MFLTAGALLWNMGVGYLAGLPPVVCLPTEMAESLKRQILLIFYPLCPKAIRSWPTYHLTRKTSRSG